jgi:hypothetical protein
MFVSWIDENYYVVNTTAKCIIMEKCQAVGVKLTRRGEMRHYQQVNCRNQTIKWVKQNLHFPACVIIIIGHQEEEITIQKALTEMGQISKQGFFCCQHDPSNAV